MTVQTKEINPGASSEEQESYSSEEREILTKINSFMSGKPFHYLDIDRSILEPDRTGRKTIAAALVQLAEDIHLGKKEASAFLEYQDLHFDEPDYAWLQELHPGVNINGWRLAMVLMDPLQYGKNVGRREGTWQKKGK